MTPIDELCRRGSGIHGLAHLPRRLQAARRSSAFPGGQRRPVNTHLESLPVSAHWQRRAVQLGTIAHWLRWAGGGTGLVVVGGIVGGDMNAIVLSDGMSDGMLHEQNGLVDTWEERGGGTGRGVPVHRP